MAYCKVTRNRKGELVARIQASGKDVATGQNKIYTKRIYNTENLTEARFRKYADRVAAEYEIEIQEAYEQATVEIRTRIPTFNELMREWMENIKTSLSYSYYKRAEETARKFGAFLEEHRLDRLPVSEIKVRDIQLFLNSFSLMTYEGPATVKLKRDLPATVNFRELARVGIIDRGTSYNMRRKGANVVIETAERICEYCHIDIDEYFERNDTTRHYSMETVKGHRRILRTVFNEAIRYEWIERNPVSGTKIAAGAGNTSLRPIKEKEVFSFREAQAFLQRLNGLPKELIYKVIPLKFMLLTGVRIAEMNGLKWCDIDYDKKVVHIVRSRLYAKAKGGNYEKEPKTRTSTRDIPLPDSLIADLREYEEWFRIADANFDFKLDQYYLASNIYRQPVSVTTIGQWLAHYEKLWGTKKISCHGLRHTYCSLLLAQNVPIQTVSKYMGHSDSTITLKVYSHFIPDTVEQVVYALNNILN